MFIDLKVMQKRTTINVSKSNKKEFSLMPGIIFILVYTTRSGIMKNGEVIEEDNYNSCLTICSEMLLNPKPHKGNVCSQRSFARADKQKVVSFSFWGEMNTGYFQGIIGNLDLMDILYPGWIMRLYVSNSKLDEDSMITLCRIQCNMTIGKKFDICSVDALAKYGDLSSIFGMLWRFLPMLDPSVDIMVSRDLDSRITKREVAAVNEWLESDLSFHVMRDNPHHGTEILGGMWGARMDNGKRKQFREIMEELVEAAKAKQWRKGFDQTMLTKYIWPSVKSLSLVHDSYLCKTYHSENWKPFPTKRYEGSEYNFVGAAGPMILKRECPKECRPKDHQDWNFC